MIENQSGRRFHNSVRYGTSIQELLYYQDGIGFWFTYVRISLQIKENHDLKKGK